uniref:Uncharacterized protein n=1 Tax=Candidatus Kentrum sp. LFY TaxID=2126342 RepID=A0A450WRM6_9GAMM|nr:MAG: hypothetical protein BECKLFY1418C_GA0070996_106117 [Candidatus Kentron sp. LFY]
MNDDQIKTLEQVQQFLAGIPDAEFSIRSKDGRYKWIEQIRFCYQRRSRTEKGLLLDFIGKVSGYSRIQTKPLTHLRSQVGNKQNNQGKSESTQHDAISCVQFLLVSKWHLQWVSP